MKLNSALIMLLSTSVLIGARATAATPKPTLADQLTAIRGKVVDLEAGILDSARGQKQARSSVRKIQSLIRLQRQERELGRKRLGELEAKVLELEARRGTLADRVSRRQAAVRHSLVALERAEQASGTAAANTAETEKLEAPRRKVLANLADHGLKEAEALKADVADAEQLENRIQDEKQQLAYLFQDLQEQAGILELNRRLQIDLIRRKHDERLKQLATYHRLRTSEHQIQHLLGQFNARMELEREMRKPDTAFAASPFAHLKGRLGLPVADGRIVSAFGRSFDTKSRLFIFKKGVDIASAKFAGVRAISDGRIAYSGELPEYGRVAIIDHGGHFYTICAHLGELKRRAGDAVSRGDLVGLADDAGTPVYFEIRARNVAVNPLQWVGNDVRIER